MVNKSPSVFSARLVVQLLLVVVVLPAVPLLVSGDSTWWEAWAFLLVTAIGFVLSRRLAARRHPDLIAERARSMTMEDAKAYDKLLAPAVAFGVVVVGIVAGLDRRWQGNQPPFPSPARWLAFVLIVGTYAFATWALVENRFFSGVVRIQRDRGHRVVSSGPYRLVRHPGYAGTLFFYAACPVLLSSLWAFVPAALTIAALVVRTALEDRTLRSELPGYAEYSRSVRYRLIPGVW